MAKKEIDECCGQKPEWIRNEPGNHISVHYGYYECKKCGKEHVYEVVNALVHSPGMHYPAMFLKVR